MTARPFLLALLGALTLLAQGAPETPPPEELSALMLHQVAERQALQQQATDSEAALARWYGAAIEALKKDAVSKGDLDGVLALDAERDRVGRELTPEEKAKLPAALRTVRAQFDQGRAQRAAQQTAALTASLRAYVAALEALEKRFTQRLEIDGALAVRKERAAATELLAASQPAPAAAAMAATPPPPAAPPKPFFSAASPTPAPSGAPGHHIVITGLFDTDDLVIQKGSLHIEHRGGTKPDNVTVNGRKWPLRWTDNRSNSFSINPPLVFGPVPAELKKVKTRAQVSITEQPSADPNSRLVIHIRDDAAGQAEVELTAMW